MKKSIVLALLMAIICSVTACKDESSKKTSSLENGGASSVVSSSSISDSSLETDSSSGLEEIEKKNFVDTEDFTFFPTSSISLGVGEFKKDFLESKFYTSNVTYQTYLNCTPEEIAKKYNIGAFKVITTDATLFFIWYDGHIERIGSNFVRRDDSFIHFALTDINHDGYFELLCSYNYTRKEDTKWDFCWSHIAVFDSKSKMVVDSYPYSIYDYYVYFKKNDDNQMVAMKGAEKNIESANTLHTVFVENTSLYVFMKKSLSLQSENYSVELTIDEKSIHFPVHFLNRNLEFSVDVKMTYLGETFTYTSPDTYCEVAKPRFVSGANSVPMEGWMAGAALTDFTIETGQVLAQDFNFYDAHDNRNKEGVYDLYITYRGEEIFVEDFLVIVYI